MIPSTWPSPMALDGEAMHGIAGEIIRLLEPCTEADPGAMLIQLLTALGNVIGDGSYVVIENTKHPPRLFSVVVGQTAKSRKGTSWAQIRSICSQVDPEWAETRIMGGLSSGEGLIRAVDKDQPDTRLLAVESELGSVLRKMGREGNTLSAILRQAWDGGELGVLTRSNPLTATNARISLIGHVTFDELKHLIDPVELANGLANRMLWVCARRSKVLPFSKSPDQSHLSCVVDDLQRRVARARTIGQVELAASAKPTWEQIYRDLDDGRAGTYGLATARSEPYVMRIALLFALLDGAAQIDVQHLSAAREIWRYCDRSAEYIFGRSTGLPLADRILTGLVERGTPMTTNEISRTWAKGRPSEQLSEALALLRNAGLVGQVLEQTGGRPRTLWMPDSEKLSRSGEKEEKVPKVAPSLPFLPGSSVPASSHPDETADGAA